MANKTTASKAPKAPATKNEVTVVGENGAFIRTYSKAKHGEDFQKLAEEFVSKVPGRKIV